METYLEKVTSLAPLTMASPALGQLLAELTEREDRLDIKKKDIAAAAVLVRTEFLRRMTKQGVTSMRVDGAGLFTKSVTNRMSSENWAVTYEWLAQEQARIIASGGNPGEIFSWLGRTISAELCKHHLATHGNLPAGIKVTPQVTLTFRPSKE